MTRPMPVALYWVMRVRNDNRESRQQLIHQFPVHVGEPEIAAMEAEGELGVNEAEQVQKRGMQVVDVDAVGGGVEAEFVAFAESESGLDAAAGHPHGEDVGMMVAAVVA